MTTRPKTRGDCVDGPRPCPFPSCRHHLWLDGVTIRGELRSRFSSDEATLFEDMTETCSLDAAAGGPHANHVIGALMGGFTSSRVQQIEVVAHAKFRRAVRHLEIALDDEPWAAAETASHPPSTSDLALSFQRDVDRAYKRVVPESHRTPPLVRRKTTEP